VRGERREERRGEERCEERGETRRGITTLKQSSAVKMIVKYRLSTSSHAARSESGGRRGASSARQIEEKTIRKMMIMSHTLSAQAQERKGA